MLLLLRKSPDLNMEDTIVVIDVWASQPPATPRRGCRRAGLV